VTVVVIIGVCIILAILGFLLPRMSWWPQRGVDRTLGKGQSVAGKAPGKTGEWAEKPFSASRKAADRSAQKGREARAKMPD
jgi:hypothetical protein